MTESPEPQSDPLQEERTRTTVRVRRSPKYFTFIVIGGALGILTAMILTFSFPKNEDFSQGQIFGFLALVCVVVGIAIFGSLAILLDRLVGRKEHVIDADKLYVHPVEEPQDLHEPVAPTTTEGTDQK
ncbi:hypothetical protein D9V34_04055 [Mycetocola lacteus]|uniref:Potassium transporter Trk n=1 Tax=Mycetocola lacteus TaxID=76637 RepID=A0A3L7AXT9_9MICO|nr:MULTISPECIES: hypothetical protein [Mycetocola]MCS4277368.1 ATP/ADP translocase [Mycetocola sp. BIGb0189]RLP83982.1 hypothetical protein D9V34_04055 [Mycetocola lacteus]